MIDTDFKIKVALAYWVCRNCGVTHGAGISKTQIKKPFSVWHMDKCDICDMNKSVTNFNDFGGPKDEYLNVQA